MVTKRPHYVPQLYLEYFLPSSEPRHFWVYYKGSDTPKPQTPINTAVECHLYTKINPNGTKDYSLESEVFDPVEQLAKPVLDRWQKMGTELVDDDVARVAPFLSFMHTRVPRSIEFAKEVGSFIKIKSARDMAEEPKELKKYINYLRDKGEENIPTLEEMQDLAKNIGKRRKIEMDKYPALIMCLSLSEHITALLLGMEWHLCESSSSTKFITGDTPFTPFVLDPNGHALFGGNFLSQDIEISFPISPNICLIINRKPDTLLRRVGSAFVKEINRRTAFMAERFVVSPFKSKYIQSLVKEFSFTLGRSKIDKDAIYKRLKQKGYLTS